MSTGDGRDPARTTLVRCCGRTAQGIEKAFWLIAFLIAVNATILWSRPKDIALLDRVELAQQCRDIVPLQERGASDLNDKCLALVPYLKAEGGSLSKGSQYEPWDRYIERKQKTLDYRRSVFKIPGIGFPVKFYHIEIPFGLLYLLSVLFLASRVTELESYLRDIGEKNVHLLAAGSLIRRRGISPRSTYSKVGITLLFTALVASNAWNIALFHAARRHMKEDTGESFLLALVLCGLVFVASIYLFISWHTLPVAKQAKQA